MLLLLSFFNDTATTEIYTLSLHDALPSSGRDVREPGQRDVDVVAGVRRAAEVVAPARPLDVVAGGHDRRVDDLDRKSTRLNSSHANTSYAVFCLKKKKQKPRILSHPSFGW